MEKEIEPVTEGDRLIAVLRDKSYIARAFPGFWKLQEEWRRRKALGDDNDQPLE